MDRSTTRRHRRTAALADLDRMRAKAMRTRLDVNVQAANTFLMLQEWRRTAALVGEQSGARPAMPSSRLVEAAPRRMALSERSYSAGLGGAMAASMNFSGTCGFFRVASRHQQGSRWIRHQ
jgi:hypothetical protein